MGRHQQETLTVKGGCFLFHGIRLVFVAAMSEQVPNEPYYKNKNEE